jgi:broad specificity phosphatase PhoE
MVVTITYFVHGSTYDNDSGRSSGHSDVELSVLGVQQSIQLRQAIKDKKYDAVFSSDLVRAVKTAEIAFGGRGIPIKSDKRIRECNYGDFNNKESAIVEPIQKKSVTNPFPNGESYEMVQKRIHEFLDYLLENFDGKHIAIVAHKAPQLAIEVITQGKTWEEAFRDDWRPKGAWKPGWDYVYKKKE